MSLATERLVLRPWQKGDEEALVRHADNRKVSINLRDHFPSPLYEGRRAFVDRALPRRLPSRPRALPSSTQGEPIGGVGLQPMADVARFTAEVGYWLGEPFWGRGFATEALLKLTSYAFERFAFERLEAWVFATNPALGRRVLEKAGYEREATMRRAAFKDGTIPGLSRVRAAAATMIGQCYPSRLCATAT